jgi:lipopolysaccharide/colanic/teichoic acid biosynthesis glycosyltransferase
MMRVFDVTVAAVGLAVASPVLAVIAVVIVLTSPGGALFRQIRLGEDAGAFVMYKFRTMYISCDDQIHRDFVRRLLEESAPPVCGVGTVYKLVDDPRITPVGRLLRRLSLDEVPQLFNVIRGDMSLVGPRPVLPWEAELFSPHHRVRFQVRPGITGLWQASGRNRLTMIQALDLDVQYVERQSFLLDLAILCRTVPVVLGCRGAR